VFPVSIACSARRHNSLFRPLRDFFQNVHIVRLFLKKFVPQKIIGLLAQLKFSFRGGAAKRLASCGFASQNALTLGAAGSVRFAHCCYRKPRRFANPSPKILKLCKKSNEHWKGVPHETCFVERKRPAGVYE
jgi:hypothetical protein